MDIYIIVYIVSYLLFKISCSQKNTKFRIVLLTMCVLSLSAVAGYRDITVGTDVLTYGVNVWDNACDSNIKDAFDKIGIEKGYLLINFVVSRFTDSINWFFFFHYLIIVGLAVCAACRMRKYGNGISEFLFAAFLLYDYIVGLSLMRQMVAVMILFYGSTYLFERKYLPFFICYIISTQFHGSAAFAIILPAYVWALDRFSNKVWMVNLVAILLMLIMLTSFKALMMNLVTGGLIMEKYSKYANQTGYSTHKINILMYALLFFPLMFIREKDDKNLQYTRSLIILGFCITMMGSIVEIATRISIYVDHLIFIYYLFTFVNKKNRSRLSFVAHCSLLIFWLYYVVYTNSGEQTIPYTSKILGIG